MCPKSILLITFTFHAFFLPHFQEGCTVSFNIFSFCKFNLYLFFSTSVLVYLVYLVCLVLCHACYSTIYFFLFFICVISSSILLLYPFSLVFIFQNGVLFIIFHQFHLRFTESKIAFALYFLISSSAFNVYCRIRR